ncbi:MAG: galactosyldiacylglycerol synthase [Chloroflexi bacterium]|nr:galactosyldiacylglycerol synthase [Chloroflexota bacterium]
MPPKRVLFLMSDTGGGHRAAARSIQAAMESLYPDNYTYDIVDVFRDYTPFPFKHMPEIYPFWVTHSSFTWWLGYVLTDGPKRSRWWLNLFYMAWRGGFHRLFEEHEADIVVCVHSLLNRAALRVLYQTMSNPPPFVTVVTDLVSTPLFWYQKREDLCLVATQKAYERGLKMGLRYDQLKRTGLPVHPDFVNSLTDKHTAREALGWDHDQLTVLMVSGGDGMGPVYHTARAIDAQQLDIQLAIVAGRNESLQRKLESSSWNQPTHIYPFVNYMAQLMAASDILITKAGPSTIAEACVAGLPMILKGKIPGQEDGNVDLVVENGAGVYAPRPHQVAEALAEWVGGPPERLDAHAAAAKRLANPEAAWTVAREVHQIAQHPPARRLQPTRGSWSLLFPGARPGVSTPPEHLL